MSELRTHKLTLAPAEYVQGTVHSIPVPPPGGSSDVVGKVLAFRAYNPTDMALATAGSQWAGLAYNVGGTVVEALTATPAAATDRLEYATGTASDPSSGAPVTHHVFGSEMNAVHSDAVGLLVLFFNDTNVANSGNVEFELVTLETTS